MLRFGLVWRALLLILGLYWCREIFGRMRDDIAEFKESDATRRGVILLLWAVTVVILTFIFYFVFTLILNIVHAF